MDEGEVLKAPLILLQHLVIQISSASDTTSAESPASTSSKSAMRSVTVVSSATLTLSDSAPPSAAVVSSGPSPSSHGISKEGATFGVPLAVLSVVVILLAYLFIRDKRRSKSAISNALSQVLTSRSSSATRRAERNRSEMSTDMAAVEMEARRDRPELVA